MAAKIKFVGGGPRTTDAQLDQCEKALRIKLPPSYRALLLTENGGKPTPGYFLNQGGDPIEVQMLLAVGHEVESFDLASATKKLRERNNAPNWFLPIAQLQNDITLLLAVSRKDAGNLYIWGSKKDGFRLNDPVYSNVTKIWFRIDELLQKLGRKTGRKDPDAYFFKVTYHASDDRNGPLTVRKAIDQGYDINYVPHGFRHPIFSAIDGFASNHRVNSKMVELFLNLGTRTEHVDIYHDNATVVDYLQSALVENQCYIASLPNGNLLHKVAVKRVEALTRLLQQLRETTRKKGC